MWIIIYQLGLKLSFLLSAYSKQYGTLVSHIHQISVGESKLNLIILTSPDFYRMSYDIYGHKPITKYFIRTKYLVTYQFLAIPLQYTRTNPKRGVPIQNRSVLITEFVRINSMENNNTKICDNPIWLV